MIGHYNICNICYDKNKYYYDILRIKCTAIKILNYQWKNVYNSLSKVQYRLNCIKNMQKFLRDKNGKKSLNSSFTSKS